MSDPVTALNGAASEGSVRVEDAGLQGMITLRGDLAELKKAGVDVPAQGTASGSLGEGSLWMSPDELLVLCAYEEAEAKTIGLSTLLKGKHHLAANVSDARAVFRLTGEGAAIREVLAKLSPADLRTSALPVGTVRRTRMAQVPAAFWFASEGEAVVICFRSVADYVFGLLGKVSGEGGEVGHFGA